MENNGNLPISMMPFMGVVEKASIRPPIPGQVKVRAFGIHPGKEIIATDDLPWSTPIIGTYNTAFKPPEENMWVFGFFADGREAQVPFLLGAIPSVVGWLPDPENKTGYGTATGQTQVDKLGESSMAPEATQEGLENSSTVVKNALGGREFAYANGDIWTFPVSSYAGEYPHVWAHKTSSGHVIELDDTPDRERVHIFHRTGSSIEIDSAGEMNIVTAGQQHLMVTGSRLTGIEGNEALFIGGDFEINAQRGANIVVKGDANIITHGDLAIRSGGKLNLDAADGINMKAPKINIEASAESITLKAAENVKADAADSVHVHAGSAIHGFAGSEVDWDSASIATSPSSEIGDPIAKKVVPAQPITNFGGGGYNEDVDEGDNEFDA